MRGLVTIFAISVALWSVTLTSNHYRVRWYLWAHLAATFCIEAYFALGGDGYGETYYWLYVLVSCPVLLTALLIAQRMVLALRYYERWKWVAVPAACAAVGFLTTPLDTRVRVFLAMQGAILAMAGMMTLSVALLRMTTPYLTLGGLWIGQAIMFFMYAKGLTINPENWNAIGEWLPAVVVIVAMFKLAHDYLGMGTESEA